MGKMKFYDLAKELNIPSKELLEKAKTIGIEIKSYLSNIEDEDSKKIRERFGVKSKNSNDVKPKENKPKKENTSKKDNPVIIRREVIIKEEVQDEKKFEKTKRDKQNSFEKRKDKKNFNIVYRNKPEKPLTVSELFGLDKENKKKQEDVEVKNKMKEEQLPKKAEIKEEVSRNNEKNVKQPMANNKVQNNNQEKTNNKFQKNNQEFANNRYNQQNNGNNNRFQENRQDRNNKFQNRRNKPYNNNYKNNNEENNYQNRRREGYTQNQNSDRFQKRDNKYQNGERKNWNKDKNFGGNNNNRFNNNNQNGRNGYNNNKFGRRTLDEKGIEKNIKDIMNIETEKENTRDYNRNIDKQKNNNKFDETRNNKRKNRKNNQNYEQINEGKLKNLKQRNNLSGMFEDQEDSMLDYYDLTTVRGRKGKKKATKNGEERTKQKIFKLTEITIPATISVKDLAQELKKTASEVIMKLMSLGIMATLNNDLDFDTAYLVAAEFGVTANKKEEIKEEDILFDESEDLENELVERPPVVVVMGHVDHGKTSLLDVIRKTNVIEGEAGGITQAIGAYKVSINNREITFLDTPGHEAFTQMRARGAQVTDIAILVVAANDGVKPQTIEAINHAKSAGIPIIVAINKIDLPDSNPQKVKEELMRYELVPEEWGGDTIYVEISAKKGINIDQLLEMVLLEADVLELKANPNKQAKGVVIEARLDKAKGPIASVLVQRGSLDVGDTVVVGTSIGRIRSMVND